MVWIMPVGIMLDIKSADKIISKKNTKVNINNFDPYSSVFSHEAPIDSKTLLSSNIICAANNENLAVKYIPGSMSIKNPIAEIMEIVR